MGKAKDIIRKLKRLLRGEVFYVNGPDTLPPPLTRSEEAEVFAVGDGRYLIVEG